MRLGFWMYLILFFVFLGLALLIGFQNLSSKGEITVLWMKTTTFVLVLVVNFLGLLQGIFLISFFKSFFGNMQRPELSKFDLDKPL